MSARGPVRGRCLGLISSVVLLALVSLPHVVLAETFDLAIHRYCAPGTLCGYPDDDAFKAKVCAAVDEMNAEWRAVGYSFRPTIFAVDSTSPSVPPTGAPAGKTKYYQTAGCKQHEDDRRLREHWKQAIAKPNDQVISMMVTNGPNLCCSGIAAPTKPESEMLGIFCDANVARGGIRIGSVWAHEMGHHWGLVHTHGGHDPADTAPAAPQNDHDATTQNLSGPVLDTPADPLGFESYREDANGNALPGRDEDEDGNVLVGHEWCETTPQALDTPWGNHTTYCDIVCKGLSATGNYTLAGTPHPWASMSYYGWRCKGPYRQDGELFQAYSRDSVARIHAAREEVPLRVGLPDICADQGKDFDGDGVCGFQDLCPGVSDSCELDSDGDGVPDSCDLCPDDPIATGDLDGDGVGDACDNDKDGDGCAVGFDLDDLEAAPKSGTVLAVNCPQSSYAATSPETFGIDSDGDGLMDCADPDDDNDGIPDSSDACRLVPGDDPFDCMGNTSCPLQNWWDVCLLGGCNELLGVLTHAVNPDPTREVRFDLVSIVERTLFLSPAVGTTIESLAAIEGLGAVTTAAVSAQVVARSAAAKQSAQTEPPRRLQLELRHRASGERVAVVGSFDPGRLYLDGARVARAPYLALRPDGRGDQMGLWVDAAYVPRLLEKALPDRDRDTVPDLVDNCPSLSNRRQADRDRDGVGDACDADLDGNGRVDRRDLRAIKACAGVDLSLEIPFWEPSLDGARPLDDAPSPEELDFEAMLEAQRCRHADLDGDGSVSRRDVARARSLRGRWW